MPHLDPFTQTVCGLGLVLVGAAIAFVLLYNRPQKRRHFRDRDEHESGIW